MDKHLFQNQLKELYFQNQRKVDGKKKIPYHFKTTNDILKNITQKKGFSRIKERLYISKVLEKILLKAQLNWISYSYINNKNTLVIYAKNHIAQSELNYHKKHILKSFHTIEKYQHINKVSILRDTKKNILQKQENKRLMVEKSYGIFENNIKNKQLSKRIENIRGYILKNKL